MRTQWMFVALVALAVGCAEVSENPTGAEGLVTEKPDFDVRKLPAYPLPGERYGIDGKADQFDDIRFADPSKYAITQPPALSNWRHMTEWEEMESLILTVTGWPASDDKMRQMYVDIVANTTPVAEAWLIHSGDPIKNVMTDALTEAGVDMAKVKFFDIPNESIWHIDYGPMPIVDQDTNNVAFVDWNYYHQRPLDDAIATQLGREIGVTTYRYQNNMEGGNFQGDGNENCFISNRGLQFSGLSQDEFETGHKDYLNCDNVRYLKDITVDGTGHIDMFFKQYAKDGVIMGYYKDGVDDTNQARMDDNAALIEAIDLAEGGKIQVHRIIMPGFGFDGEQQTNIPFTYANSTLINGVNLWPAFSYPQWADSKAEALATWKEAMPNYTHIDILADDVSLASGAIHCITRTVPKLNLAPTVPDGTCTDDACVPPEGFEETAYTGACIEGECFGPAWLCGCNDCTSDCTAPEPSENECEGLTFEGCCDVDTLTWCDGGALRTQSCDGATCGWDGENGFYNCNTDGADGPEEFPKACGGDVVVPCEPSCGEKECGDDGCGGSCGSCGEKASCFDGACKNDPPPCEDECSGIGVSGCSAEGKPFTCSSDAVTGCYVQVTSDCEAGQTCSDGKCEGTADGSADGETDGDTGADATGTGDDGGGSSTGGTNNASSGCVAAPTQTGTPASALLLFGVLALLAVRRRLAV
ncbi:MAG: agmatine deiminase [Myxococcota bacterium]|jgi:agmatine deiminase